MANPVPYNQLFDIDGLNNAIKSAEQASNKFNKSVQADFARTEKAASSLRAELERISASINGKPIRLTDDAGKAAVADYAKQVADLTAQINTQKAAISAMNNVLAQNKLAISDAKVAAAQYAAETAKGKSEQQAANVAIAQTSLQMRQLALANRQAAQSQTAASGSYKEAQQRLTALGNSIKNTKDGFNSTNPAIQAQIRAYVDLNDKLKAFDAQMGNHQRNVGNYGSALTGVADKLATLALGYLTIQSALNGAMKVFDTALQTDASRAALGYILGNVDLADVKIKKLKETANLLGLEFVSLGKAYSGFIAATTTAGFSLDNAEKVFYAVARASAVLHLSSDETSRALYAIKEMVELGTVSTRQLVRQLGIALPGSLQIFEKSLGVNNVQLKEMLRSGSIISQEVLPKFAEELNKTFAPGVTKIDSMQASFSRLKNTFSGAVDDNSNITKFFTSILDGLTSASDLIAKIVNSSSWKEFFTRVKGLSDSFVGNFAGSFSSIAVADNMHANNKASKPIDDFTNASQKEQIEFLKTQTQIRDNAYKAAESNGKKEIAYYNEQQKLLVSMRNVYKQLNQLKEESVYIQDSELKSVLQINKRILELKNDALANPQNKDKDVERITALKARLKELNGATKEVKDGFALLEQQLQKVMLQLQDSIIQDYAKHQGKESAETKKLAAAYQDLTIKLNALKAAKDAALLNVARDNQIKQFGSVFPTSKPTDTTVSAGTTKSLNTAQLGIDTNDLIDGLDDITTKYLVANRTIAESYKARNITKLQYDAQMLASEQAQATETYFSQRQIAQNEVKLAGDQYGESSKQYRKAKQNLAKVDADYSKQTIDNLVDTEEKKRKIIADTLSYLEKANQAFANITGSQNAGKLFGGLQSDLLNGIGKGEEFQKIAELGMDSIGAYTDFAISASQRRQAVLEAEMQHEIEGAGTNAEAKKKIEAEYTKRVNAEKTKQAKLQKAAAAVEIIINTAIAVSKVFGQTGIFGIALAPIIGALGAIQLGLVLAQPIPQYAKGRESGNAEIAEVNERGAELIGQNGKYRVHNGGKRGYTYLNKGDKVYTADRTRQMLSQQTDNAEQLSKSRALYDTHIALQNSTNIDYDKMGSAMSEAASRIKGTEFNLDERGFNRYTITKNARIKDVRRRNSL